MICGPLCTSSLVRSLLPVGPLLWHRWSERQEKGTSYLSVMILMQAPTACIHCAEFYPFLLSFSLYISLMRRRNNIMPILQTWGNWAEATQPESDRAGVPPGLSALMAGMPDLCTYPPPHFCSLVHPRERTAGAPLLICSLPEPVQKSQTVSFWLAVSLGPRMVLQD